MLRYLFSALIVALVATFVMRTPAVAQEGGTIAQIVVDGNQRIEVETVRSYLTLTEGDPFDASKIDKSLKALFATGLFADVSIKREGTSLVVRVVENPTINRIAFEGNHHLESDKLQAEIQLKPRGVYNRTKVQGDVQRLLALYKRSGRFAASVDPKLIKLADNRVDLVFEINEGTPTYVTRIDFVGNTHFSDGDLKDVIESREERWYRFLSNSDSYDPDRVNYDREQLRKYYLKKGYADFRVVSAVAQLTPDRKRFFLTFTVEEGERYKVGKVAITSSLPDIKVDDLKPLLEQSEGDWYDANAVEKTVQAMTDAVGNKGYAFVDIKPRLDRDPVKHILGITFDIGEGRRAIVERIDIEGNIRTYDKVIRRQLALVEGDAFNSAKMRRSEQRIKDLDFFKTAKITPEDSDTASDRTIIKVKVEEKSTGSLSLGAGWSSLYGPLASIGAKERNLLGSGQEASINTTLALEQTSINFAYTDPYFLDRHLIAGFDLFSIDTRLQNLQSYQTGVTGGDLRLGYYYNEHLRHDFTYTASLTNIHDIQAGTSQFIASQAGVTALSTIGHLVTYDRRDSKIDPTTGYYVKVGNDVAGLGGTPKFVRTYTAAGQYFTLDDDYTLYINGGAGYISGYGGSDVLISQRFYLGGANLRGFRDSGVTPVDRNTLTPLGAVWNATASAEVTFPLGLPKEVDIKSKLFVDTGMVGPTDPSIPSANVLTTTMPRVSVGTGFIWVSPLGPVNIDFGFPIVKTSYDEIQIFRFNFGTRF